MALNCLQSACHLAGTPEKLPQYSVTIKNSKGEEVTLADPNATRAMVALMNQSAVNGGAAAHWGGPSAFAEINAALHAKMFEAKPWFESFNFVNDAGHAENGIYALRANYGFDGMTFESVLGFRSVESKFTGHGEAHLNPEGVFISNGPLGSGIGQAQGLALADKAIGKKRTTICVMSDGASMEGEAKEAFAAIPGLAVKGKMASFLLVVSDNNTKLSGRIDADAFSMTPSFAAMEDLGWQVIKVADGHNLEAVYHAVEQGLEKAQKGPVCIIAKTIKGKGVKSAEESASGGHGYPLKAFDGKIVGFVDEIYGGNAPSEFAEMAKKLSIKKEESKKSTDTVKKEKVQAGLSRGAIRAASEGSPVFSLSCDVPGSTGIGGFQKEFPEQCQDLGIAESNMMSTAIGLSKQGLIPIVDSFAQFGITKGALPLIMASLSQGPIIGIFSHAGFQDAADGASHQATTYVSAIASIPHVQLVHVATSGEAEEFMYQAIKYFEKEYQAKHVPDSVIFLLGRENFPCHFSEKEDYSWGKARVVREGSDVVIAATGPMVFKALEAADLLEKEGIKATIVNNCFVNRTDDQTYKKLLSSNGGRLVTIEDHQVKGGMGALLVHDLIQKDVACKVRSLGIPGHFGQSAYLADHLYDKYQLNAAGIVGAVKELL